jgi:hypothetical protein
MMERQNAPDHVVAYRASGTITGDDMDRFARDVDEALGSHDRIAVYFDATEWSDMTEEALGKRIQFGVSKFAHANRFARMAIVTDKEWIRAISRFSNMLFPLREIRTFDPDARADALSWASEAIPSG